MTTQLYRIVAVNVVIILFICWTYPRTCLGIKADPRSQFFNHAVVEPAIYTHKREKRDLSSIKFQNEEKLTIGFVAFNKNFVVDLHMNKNLFPSHYFEKYQENGSLVTYLPLQNDPTHCHYQGHMKGVKNSWAAISTCKGISGVIYDGKELHYIEPSHNSENSSHFLFRDSELKPLNLSCGYKNSKEIPVPTQVLSELKRIKRSTILQDPYQSNEKSRYLELIIVNDNKEFKEFNEDKNAVFERSKQIANIVNGLYSPLNIFIALVGTIVWTEYDEIKLAPDGDSTLTNFLHYRRERLALEHPNDNAQLITGMTFDFGVVGKALKGVMCTYQYSGGVNMDHSHVVGLVANTISHELGHNFGLEHDTDECQCPDEKCIMAPSSSSTSPKHWSSCSIEQLELAYVQGLDYCLQNQPTTIVGPVCGNGFLEENEECDCGLKEFCDNPCCNATSCRLFENATCAMGRCCDLQTCEVKKVASPCRSTKSDCDLPEFCDGISESCPSDSHRQNGDSCGNGKAYCFDGRCQSHADQCKLLWGPTGKMSDQRCYQQNYKGNVNGNCGYNRENQTYKECKKEDILCGLLHCTHLSEKLLFGMETAAILAHSFINVKGKVFTCRSAIVDLGLSNIDPGLAPNGASCGNGKACMNQKCVPVPSMKQTECLYGCSGNGVCNNRGNCHCNVGYAPPYCDSPGPGGSIDSGPASDPSNYYFKVAMYVIFFGLLPLIVLSAVLIYYYRSHLKAWWAKKAHKANIKSRTTTTTQMKAHPQSKFNFDRNSLRTLEISGPIQVPPPPTLTGNSYSTMQNRNALDRANLSEFQLPTSNPAIQGQEVCINSGKSDTLIPIRPAPPRPISMAKPVSTTSVQRTPSLPAGNRPLSSATFRPNCPPPRPPLPKTPSAVHQEELPSQNERSATPNSSFYDDCQTLDFSPSVHKPVQKANASFNLKKNPPEGRSSFLHKQNKKNLQNNQAPNVSRALPHGLRTNENSVVASLAQKFEKQDNVLPGNSSNALMPPFKTRPLPLPPGRSSNIGI
ncbi:hypothetical protein JTE90_004389 [Oedothorax gibbosus]|uniref:Disintegrin and metalloproteinase domain-containing protein 12 n=1 Tax=Oedothorax gibbosus TaxID=931172 RepID=A0AAV6UNN3_9ARAC|nr:hypothetical protein JTE90_004389 [Oedothorax gibbosus]